MIQAPARSNKAESVQPAARLGGHTRAVPVADGTIVVEARGHGPAVLFIHGWTLDRRAWSPQSAMVAKRWKVLAFDRRGCGQSTAPPCLAGEADDVARLLDDAAIDRCTLVAMSQGTGGVRAQAQLNETLTSITARIVLRPQIVVASAHEKIKDGKLADQPTLDFILAGVDDLLRDIADRGSVAVEQA